MSNNHPPNPALSFDECDQAFQVVQSCRTVDEASHAFMPLLKAYIPTIFSMNSNVRFWRARKEAGERWKHIADIGPPPLDRAHTNRFNGPGEPMFYGATNHSTALIEIGAKENDRILMGAFRPNPDQKFHVAVFGELHHAERTNTTRLGRSDSAARLKETLQRCGLERGQSIQYIDAFFASILADPNAKNDGYVLTRGFAKAVNSHFVGVQGIIYPSVRYDAGLNIAVKADVYETHLEPRLCSYLAIEKVREFGFISFKQIACAAGLSNTAEFNWATPRNDHQYFEFNMSAEEVQARIKWMQMRGIGLEGQNDDPSVRDK